MFNADPEDFRVIDSGKKRTVRDVITMQGGKNAATAAAAARLLCLHINGDWDQKKTTRSDIVEFNERYFDCIQKASTIGKALSKNLRIPSSHFAAVYAYVDIISDATQQLDEFVESVATGSMLAKDSSVLALRNWTASPKVFVDTHAQRNGVAIITKAWNAYSIGAPMKLAVWRSKESMPHPLPSQY